MDKYQQKRENKIRKRKLKKEKKTEGKVIQTLATSLGKTHDTPEIVTFSAYRSKKKTSCRLEEDEVGPMMSMDQARLDVFKFGLNALSRKDRVDAKIALAIKLGAEPPRNKCIPLQELKEKRKMEKLETKKQEEENETKLINKSNRNSKNKPSSKGSKKKKSSGSQMKIGSFDGGMLKLSGAELKKMKSK